METQIEKISNEIADAIWSAAKPEVFDADNVEVEDTSFGHEFGTEHGTEISFTPVEKTFVFNLPENLQFDEVSEGIKETLEESEGALDLSIQVGDHDEIDITGTLKFTEMSGAIGITARWEEK